MGVRKIALTVSKVLNNNPTMSKPPRSTEIDFFVRVRKIVFSARVCKIFFPALVHEINFPALVRKINFSALARQIPVIGELNSEAKYSVWITNSPQSRSCFLTRIKGDYDLVLVINRSFKLID